jgi:hypothetical protein
VKELHSETALPCTWKGAFLKQLHQLDFRTNTEYLQQKYGKESSIERALDDSTCPFKSNNSLWFATNDECKQTQ